MKTYPTQHITSYNIALANLIASKLGRIDKIRIAQVGAGVVILPDTNCKQDLSENEMRKALHIDGKAPKEETRKVKLCSVSPYDDREPCYLELTEEQYELLDWLAQNDWLYDETGFEENPSIEFKRI